MLNMYINIFKNSTRKGALDIKRQFILMIKRTNRARL